jgi:TRAP-type uncharacterized transport system substrate-binding protein
VPAPPPAPTASLADARPASRLSAAPRRWLDTLLAAGPVLVGLLLLGLVALLWAAYRVLDPTPDKHIVIATGPEQGAYIEFAQLYQPLLEAHGLSVELRASEGSAQNLAWLHDPHSGVHAAFVQSGVEVARPVTAPAGEPSADPAGDAPASTRPSAPVPTSVLAPLVSLGSVAKEPLWLFYRDDSLARHRLTEPPTRLAQLQGWRIHTGPRGGGTGAMFARLAEANGLQTAPIDLDDQPTVHAVVELVQGRVDALALVSAADAPLVQYLLQTPGVRLFDFAQSEAYGRRFPFLRPVVLPRGVVDLAADRPGEDVRLVAATASLLARADLHPALVQLLVQAAHEVHGEAGWFAQPREFPNPSATVWPLAGEAERYYRSGAPWLQRHLPFWLANFVERMWIVVLPLLAVALPLSRVLPPLVTLRLRSRVFRWYAHLREIEGAIEQPGADCPALREALEKLDVQTERIGVPLSYAHELYDLREHIHLVRKRLLQRTGAAPAG